jgi:hypothetical protein
MTDRFRSSFLEGVVEMPFLRDSRRGVDAAPGRRGNGAFGPARRRRFTSARARADSSIPKEGVP